MRPFHELTTRGRAARLRPIVNAALESRGLRGSSVRFLAEHTNMIFRADHGDRRFAIRVSSVGPLTQPSHQVRAELSWQRALAESELVVVPRPIPNLTGDLFDHHEATGVPGRRRCVVFSWVGGRQLDEVLSLTNMGAYGRLAAGLHIHAATYRPQANEGKAVVYDNVFPFDEPTALWDAGSDLLTPTRLSLFRDAEERVVAAMSQLKDAPPRLLHGDLHIWNVLASRGRLAAIDFEDVMWGWPIQDLGTSMYYLHLRDDYAALRDAFRRGYEESAPWPESSTATLDTFIAGRCLVLGNDVVLLSRSDGEQGSQLDAEAWFSRAETRMRAVLH